jgi:hypothetical protein
MLASPPIHVIPDEFGAWSVQPENAHDPISRHDNATDAERAALRHAMQIGARGVIVHDRYGRLHRAGPHAQ